MPRYEVVTQARKHAPYTRSFAEAPSLPALNGQLFHQNRPVVQVREATVGRPSNHRVRLPLRVKLGFLEQLETCTYLGMDVRTALGICIDGLSTRKRAARELAGVVRELRTQVSRGTSFARALSLYPAVFDEVTVGLIAAGEEGGTFADALTNVRRIWARNEELRHRLAMMLVYPAIVLIAATGVVWLLITRVVPQFISVLAEMKADLPLATRVLVAVSHGVTGHPAAVALSLVGLMGVTARVPPFIKRHPILHRLAWRLPVAGRLLGLLVRANFSRTFAQLKRAHAKTTQALLLCRDLSWNYEYRSAIARALVRVQRGEPLSRSLSDDVEIFGEMMVNGIRFMEMSGAGTEGLERLTELLERELDGYIGTLRQVLDPLLIVLLGLVIGGIVFATFLPALQIMQNI
ncbi:MAG TPA: type II secretion system F family protein [Chthoniobacterales bacterium]